MGARLIFVKSETHVENERAGLAICVGGLMVKRFREGHSWNEVLGVMNGFRLYGKHAGTGSALGACEALKRGEANYS